MSEEFDENSIIERRERINRVILLLNSVNEDMEREFVAMGNRIQVYYSDSKSIKNACAEIADTFSSQILQKGNTHIEMLFHNIQDYFQHLEGEFKNSETVLSSIKEILESLEDDLTGYDKIIKILRMLGISTRIESVRLFHENNTFEVIAVNVDKLSGVVQDKTKIIRDNIKMLNLSIADIQGQINIFQTKKDEKTKEIFNQIQNCIQVLDDKYAGYSGLVSKIADSGESIYTNMSHMVSSIQFHDITRQQIEHVIASLNELYTELSNLDGQIAPEKMGYLKKVCRVQAAQLQHSQETIQNAVFDLTGNLEGIGKNAEEAITQTINMLGAQKTKTESINFIDEIGRFLGEINSELKHSNELSAELSNSIRDMLTIAEKLSMFIYEIEEIGSEIELIALNASIKAAHTGKEGAGLGVIADAIQKISGQATDQSEQTAASLRRITSISENIQQNIQSSLKEKLFAEVTRIDAEVNNQLNETHGFEKAILSKVHSLQTEIQNLRIKLHETVKKTQIGDIVSRSLSECVNTLEECISGINEDDTTNPDGLSHLKHKYTMKSERDIHHSLEREDKYRKTSRTATMRKNSNDADLGDNVELF